MTGKIGFEVPQEEYPGDRYKQEQNYKQWLKKMLGSHDKTIVMDAKDETQIIYQRGAWLCHRRAFQNSWEKPFALNAECIILDACSIVRRSKSGAGHQSLTCVN